MRIRVLRVIEYEGEAEWVYDTLSKNGVKGCHTVNGNTIRDAVLGTVPEILEKAEKENT